MFSSNQNDKPYRWKWTSPIYVSEVQIWCEWTVTWICLQQWTTQFIFQPSHVQVAGKRRHKDHTIMPMIIEAGHHLENNQSRDWRHAKQRGDKLVQNHLLTKKSNNTPEFQISYQCDYKRADAGHGGGEACARALCTGRVLHLNLTCRVFWSFF